MFVPKTTGFAEVNPVEHRSVIGVVADDGVRDTEQCLEQNHGWRRSMWHRAVCPRRQGTTQRRSSSCYCRSCVPQMKRPELRRKPWLRNA